MISIEEFEEIYNLIPGEPEFELWFDEDRPQLHDHQVCRLRYLSALR